MGIFKIKKEIGPDTVIQRNNNLLVSEIHDEIVALSVKNGEYYGMNNVASVIYKLLEKPVKFDVLIDHLLTRYDISEQKCSLETKVFLLKLANKDLITIQ